MSAGLIMTENPYLEQSPNSGLTFSIGMVRNGSASLLETRARIAADSLM